MKRFTKAAFAIVLVLVILGSALCAIGVGIGFSVSEFGEYVEAGEFSFGPISHIPFIWHGNDGSGWESDGFGWTSADSEENSFPWEGLDKIELKVDNSSIIITQNSREDRENIREDVEYRRKNQKRKVDVQVDGSTLKIKDSGVWRIQNDDSVRVTMRLPAELIEHNWLKKIKLDQPRGTTNVQIPLTAKEISINVGAGECEILERLSAEKKISLEVGAGSLAVEELEAEKVDINGGVGELTAAFVQAEKIEMEGGIGAIQIKAAGVETDYSYDIDCGVGSVTIGNHSYTGLSAGGEIKNQGSKEMEIDCGVGNVEVSFEGQ